MRYLPHTDQEIQEMLAVVGKQSLDALFETIPEGIRLRRPLELEPALSEARLMQHMRALAAKNQAAGWLSFLGAGMYAHHVPPAVDQLLLRSEFYTAYTPYQPEVAQGTLQAIWEFQTIVSELYGLPMANASLYDGASAAAEAVQMARRLTKRDQVLVSDCVHPDYRAVIRTYLSGGSEGKVKSLPVGANGALDGEAIRASVSDETAALVVGYPSFYGTLTDLRPISDLLHQKGALMVATNSEPYALALAASPGSLGADIVAGEGQPLACPPQFGGPGVGLFACRDDRKYLQQLPGRLCGRTVDSRGQTGYVLTLSTREQHIRRERATSNICTNQGLLALALTIRVSLLGKRGFVEVARQILSKAHYLRDQLCRLAGVRPAFPEVAPFFNEFAIKVSSGPASKLCQALEAQKILAGFDLGQVDSQLKDCLLVAVTEQHTREDLDRLVRAVGDSLSSR